MLFIFRKLRRSFFLPGKVRTYVAYAVGEIALIMIGILLALQVTDWNQARKDRAEETEILVRLKAEFEENQKELTNHQAVYTTIMEGLISFLEVMKPEPDSVPDESIHAYMASFQMIPRFRPNTAELDSIVSSGKIALIRTVVLSQTLNQWTSVLEEYHDWTGYMNDGIDTFKPFLVEHYQLRNSAEFLFEDDIGTSHFPYDQKALLSNPVLESAIEHKRLTTKGLLYQVDRLLILQHSILTLIDDELAERGL